MQHPQTPPSVEHIRNIALAGQAGCGKTSLVEAFLQAAGEKPAAGSVERGDTTTDFDPLEQRHHHSLNLALANAHYKGVHFNFLDTPGYPDFYGQTLSALAAADLMLIVVNAQAGIEPLTRRLMDRARLHHLPVMIVVNRIDAAPDLLGQRLEEIGAVFGKECLPLDLPTDHAQGVVEVLHHEDGASDLGDVGGAHEQLLEQVVEVDEAAMEAYLEEGAVPPEQLHASFEQALREQHVVPVAFTSARTGTGVRELLDLLVEVAPNPLETTPHPFQQQVGEETRELIPRPDPSAPLLAHVFKVEHDPFLGKLGLIRVHQGTLRRGASVLVGPEGRTVKIAHLFHLQGHARHEVPRAIAGEICAVAKLDELVPDAVLHERHEEDGVAAPQIRYPTPLVGLALRARSRGDEQKLSEVLHKLTLEDPCLRIEHDITANETVLRGLGDLHLRIALERMEEQYHLPVETHPPSVPYRETITRPAEARYRHKKQTGGAGQFGEVHLRIEPLERGAGFEFVDRIVGGAIPAQFIPAVEKGVRQAMASGPLSGYPVVDVRVTLLDGKTHPVDSKEIAFVVAGRKAFQQAAAEAAPTVLEPMVSLEVNAPASAMGDLSGDLAARRARISNTVTEPDGRITITAVAPLAELNDYASRLKSLTGGEGRWMMQFSHYEPAPAKLQRSLAEAARREA